MDSYGLPVRWRLDCTGYVPGIVICIHEGYTYPQATGARIAPRYSNYTATIPLLTMKQNTNNSGRVQLKRTVNIDPKTPHTQIHVHTCVPTHTFLIL